MWIKVLCIISSLFYPSKFCSNLLEVKKETTEINEQELKLILKNSHIEVFGLEPNLNRLNAATAQIFFENGAGKKIFNHNLGNIGGNPIKPQRPYYKISGARFRAFSSFNEGARCYWITLKNMCPIVLKYFDYGDIYGSSISLQKCGYYKADFNHYYLNFNSIYSTIKN